MTQRMRYVLCNNDAMLLIYDDRSDAEAEASARQREARREARDGYPTEYWHVHEVPEAEK